jgi:hypothetical protein
MLASPMILTPLVAHWRLARATGRPGLGGIMGMGALGAVPLALFMALTREGGLFGGIVVALVVLAVWCSTVGAGLVGYVDWLRREDAKRHSPGAGPTEPSPSEADRARE